MQAAQQANQQAAHDAQQAANNTQIATRNFCPPTGRPKFSVKAGSYPSSFTVKIRDKTRGATIYYTTDGWTPTTESTRCTAPITIHSTTTLNAIAIAPGAVRSRLASV
jgi:Chitobiase/beta-hexosaminidase C-terminal domain